MRVSLTILALLALAAVAWGQAGVPGGIFPGIPQGSLAGATPGPSGCSPINGLDYTKTCDTVYKMGIFQ